MHKIIQFKFFFAVTILFIFSKYLTFHFIVITAYEKKIIFSFVCIFLHNFFFCFKNEIAFWNKSIIILLLQSLFTQITSNKLEGFIFYIQRKSFILLLVFQSVYRMFFVLDDGMHRLDFLLRFNYDPNEFRKRKNFKKWDYTRNTIVILSFLNKQKTQAKEKLFL